MAKRKTKQQRIAAEKAALKQRLEDIARGAIGSDPECFTSTDYALMSFLDGEQFGRMLTALIDAFRLRQLEDVPASMRYILEPYNFDIWDKPWPEVIDELYKRGFRA